MTLEQALAVYLYTKDDVVSWSQPGKSAKEEAWKVICAHAREAIDVHGDSMERHSR